MDEFGALSIGLAALAGIAVSGVQELVRRRTEAAADRGLTGSEVSEALEETTVEPEPPVHSIPAPVTPEAKAEAVKIMKEHMRELLAEARRIAKRVNAETPSRAHVKYAADRIGLLRSRASVVSDISLAFGSLLIGVGISYQINIWTGGAANSEIQLWMVVAFGVGIGFFVGGAGAKIWGR